MKRSSAFSFNTTTVNIWLFVFRVAIAIFMLTHGLPKLEKLLAGNHQFADPFGFGPTPSLMLAVFAEVICSILILLGLITRLATIPLIITMLVAVFSAHATAPFGQKELALMYLLSYVTIAIVGGGSFSLDSLLGRRR